MDGKLEEMLKSIEWRAEPITTSRYATEKESELAECVMRLVEVVRYLSNDRKGETE